MNRPKIAIIGAGWAGLSAALALHAQAEVVLFEASQISGGRARSLNRPDFSTDSLANQTESSLTALDNGQHLLLGAYRNVLTILEQVGVLTEEVFLRLPFSWYLVDGIQIKCPHLPAPWHILVGVLTAKHFSLRDKFSLLKNTAALKNFSGEDLSIHAWLWDQNVSSKEVANFWQPLVLAAMNTPLSIASTQTLARIMQESVLKNRLDSDLLLPIKSLNELFVEPVSAYLKKHHVPIYLGQRVHELNAQGVGNVWVDGVQFDRVIVATAPYHAAKILTHEPTQKALNELQYAAITTVYLRYDQTISLPVPIVGLVKGTAQWLFERGKLSGGDNELSAVLSCADQWGHLKTDELVQKIHQDVLRCCPDLAAPISFQVITEKRATFLAAVKRTRIDASTLAKQGIFLAGDYMHPSYPGTLEGAVVSGQIAAAQCLL